MIAAVNIRGTGVRRCFIVKTCACGRAPSGSDIVHVEQCVRCERIFTGHPSCAQGIRKARRRHEMACEAALRSAAAHGVVLWDSRNRVAAKRCPGCKLWRPPTDFQKYDRFTHGLDSRCRACRHELGNRCAARRLAEALAAGGQECSSCEQFKPVGEFHKILDGIRTACKSCTLESQWLRDEARRARRMLKPVAGSPRGHCGSCKQTGHNARACPVTCECGARRELGAESCPACAEVVGRCHECNRSHEKDGRLAAIRELGLSEAADVREALPCFYPSTVAGDRLLYRDLEDLR